MQLCRCSRSAWDVIFGKLAVDNESPQRVGLPSRAALRTIREFLAGTFTDPNRGPQPTSLRDSGPCRWSLPTGFVLHVVLDRIVDYRNRRLAAGRAQSAFCNFRKVRRGSTRPLSTPPSASAHCSCRGDTFLRLSGYFKQGRRSPITRATNRSPFRPVAAGLTASRSCSHAKSARPVFQSIPDPTAHTDSLEPSRPSCHYAVQP